MMKTKGFHITLSIALVIVLLFFILFFAFQIYIRHKNDYNIRNFVHINSKGGCGSLYVNGELVKIKPEKIPLDILYEDENMLVINKPSGMLTHPIEKELNGTLVNALLYKYKENLSDAQGELCRGIVHRLDRNTSGILMVAKNNRAYSYLKRNIAKHHMQKYYLAVVKGVIKEDNITIDKPIGKDSKQKYKMMISDNGKQSKSIVKVLKRYKDATLVEVQIITGRTHQIRVHMASIGHPVYNDGMYGAVENIDGVVGQVLMSYKLIFPRPYDGKLIEIQIPMDDKLSKVLGFLGKAK